MPPWIYIGTVNSTLMHKSLIMSHFDLTQLQTPCWLFDPDIAVKNYQCFTALFKQATVAYAFKANPHSAFATSLLNVDAHFCVVSMPHLKQLLKLNIKPQQIVYSHPIKSLDEIQFALQAGVRCFACDSLAEIDKMAYFNIPAEIFIRLDMDTAGSMVPLSDKFGVTPETALELMHYAAQRGLKPIGFTFHIGSQCLYLENWKNAIKTVGSVWKQAKEAFGVDFINIGGGFAVPYANIPDFHLEDIAAQVYHSIDRYLPDVRRIVLEPGRAIVATAGALLTSVTGIAKRPDSNTWLYIDSGVFNGLFETINNIRFPVKIVPVSENSLPSNFLHSIQHKSFSQADNDGLHTYMLAGPTCDSLDKLFSFRTPESILIGDRLLFQDVGAYGYSLESSFNGYSMPNVEIVSLEKFY